MWKWFINLGTLFLGLAVISGFLADTNKYSGLNSTFIGSTYKAASNGDIWAVLCFIFSLALLAWIVYRIFKAVTNKDTPASYQEHVTYGKKKRW